MIPLHQWQGDKQDKDLLSRCKQTVQEIIPESELVLYGSRARGEAHAYSDYDIIVFVQEPISMRLKEKLLSAIYPMELETGAMLTVIPYNRNQWNSAPFNAMPFRTNVEREGVVL